MIRSLVTVLLFVSLTGCSSAREQERKEMAIYFAAVCEKEGFAKDSAEHPGCVAAKMNEAMPAKPGYVAPIPAKSGTTCQTIGNITRCY